MLAYCNGLSIKNNTIFENFSSIRGGGLYINGGNVTIDQNTITRNSSTEGSAIFINNLSSDIEIMNNNITKNVGYFSLWGAPSEFNNNNIFLNTSDTSNMSNIKFTSNLPETYEYNFWGTRSDQGDIDPSIYDDNESAGLVGQVIYQPILTSPSSTTPGQLEIVDSVFVTMSENSMELSNGVGDGYTAYIALQGEDGNPYSLDVTEVSILNMTTYFPLQPLVWETDDSTGLFRGEISISSTVYDPQNNIMKAQHGDTLQISSVADPTKVFYLPILNAWIDIPIDSLSFMEDSLLVVDFSEYIVVPPNDSSYILEISGNDSISPNVNNFEVEFSNELHWYGEELLYFTLVDTTAENSAIFEYDSVLVIVEPAQDIPVTFDVYSELLEDSSAVIIFNGIDYDNEELTFEVIEQPINGVIMDSLYIPNENYFGLDSIIYNGYDGLDYSNLSKIYFEIISVNDAPTIILPDSISFNEDDSIYVNFYNYINDVDGDSLIISIFDNDAVNIDIHSNDSIKFSANENWYGSELITFSVSDGRIRLSASDSMVVNVNSINDLPNEFQLMTPENNAMQVDLTPTFSWEIPVDLDDRSRNRNRSIESYQFILNQDTTIVTENSFIPETPLTENMEYSWQVITVDNDGGETASNSWSFWTNSVNSPPSEFSLLTPLDDEVVDTTNITFNWEASFDIDLYDTLSYQLEFGESIDSLSIVYTGTETTYLISELNDNSTYYWKVVATDLTGLTTENTNGYHSFRVNTENDNPEVFSLISPENGSMVVNLTPTFSWEIPVDLDDRSIESYQFILNQDTTIVTENSFIPETPLTENMEYSWQVIAVDNDGGETASNSWSFWTNSVNSAPSEFSLLTPLDDEETGLTPAFSWMESNDLDLYDSLTYTLKLGDDVSNLAGINLGNSINYTLEIELLDNTQYFWQVIATDVGGATFMTSLHSFMVNSENDNPEGFSLLNPQNNEILTNPNEILFWDVSIDLDGDEINYILYLDQNVDPITVIDTIQTNYYQNLQIEEDELYFWKVVSIDENGGSTATEIWSFSLNEINEPPSEFSLISPDNDEIINTVIIQLDWEASIDNDINDIVSYILEIGSNIENLDTINVGYDTSYITEELNDNTKYYWRITAIDNSGTSTNNSGSFNQFIINVGNESPSDFSLITPTYESIESNIAPLFYWENSIDNDPEDIVSYELFIDMDSSFVLTDPIELDSNGFDYSILNTVLNDNSEYYWKVNAKDLENETTTSERFLFYTDSYPEPPNAFNLVSPINDSYLDSNIIEFTWNSTTDNDPMDVFNYGFIYTDNLLDTLSFNYITDILDTSLTLELETGRIYYWHVFAMDDDSLFTFANGHQDSIWSFSLGELSLNEDIELPTIYAIYPAYPNPFNPITHIKFAIPENALISVIIYDVNGRVIEILKDGMVQAGYHNLTWDSGNNPSGLYFVKLSANKFIDTQKLMLVK